MTTDQQSTIERAGQAAAREEARAKPKPPKPPIPPRPAIPKTSYESNADVQRWLSEQAIDGRTRPAFDPTFLAGQHDRPWVLSALSHFYEQHLIDDVIQAARSGDRLLLHRRRGG